MIDNEEALGCESAPFVSELEPYVILSFTRDLEPIREVLSKAQYIMLRTASATAYNSIKTSHTVTFGKNQIYNTLKGFYVRATGTEKQIKKVFEQYEQYYKNTLTDKELKRLQRSREYNLLKKKLKYFTLKAFRKVTNEQSLEFFLLGLGIIVKIELIK